MTILDAEKLKNCFKIFGKMQIHSLRYLILKMRMTLKTIVQLRIV
jgi:hypothetical protein